MLTRSLLLRSTAAAVLAPFLQTRAVAAATEIPFETIDGFIAFEVRVDGFEKPFAAYLNTGDRISLIDTKRWAALGGKAIAHAPGHVSVSTAALTVGGVPLAPGTKLAIVDDFDSEMADIGVRTDIVLGFDAFANAVVSLDFTTHRMSLSATAPDAAASVPITYEQYQPRSPKLVTLDGFAIDDVPIAVQFDTMWTGNLILFPSKFPAPAPAWPKAAVETRKYEEGELSGVTIDRVTFSGKPFATDVVAYVPAGHNSIPTTRLAGVIGTGILADRRVTLDFVSGRIAIE